MLYIGKMIEVSFIFSAAGQFSKILRASTGVDVLRRIQKDDGQPEGRGKGKLQQMYIAHLPIFNLALMANPEEPSNLINALPFNLNN